MGTMSVVSSSSALPKLLPFSRPPSPIRSAIFKSPPDAVPSVEELQSLQGELQQLKARTLERAKKAGEDLKTIEESFRRIKEREKGKAKQAQLEKIKREQRDYTPDPEVAKPRLSSQPLSDELKKKHKKKRKRDEESDHEQDASKPRRSTPPAQHTHPPKAQKSTPSIQAAPKVPGAGDFTIPPPTPVSTFYASVEPYLRTIREEDLGYLEHTADEVEPFIMPKLGRHYLDVWAEQDALMLGATLHPGAGQLGDAPPDTYLPPAPKWDPSTLNDGDLITEGRGHGPLTERLLSALLPVGDGSAWKGVKAAEDAMEGRPGGGGSAAAKKEKLNVTDLEARVQNTMRYHGLLETVPDYSDKVDDPIATALRFAQRELRQVIARNKFRKKRLLEIAQHRIGYQEYLDNRDILDRNIQLAYTKAQKKNEPKPQKKPKKGSKLGDASASGTPVPGAGDPAVPVVPPCPAALGLGPDEDNLLVVPEGLRNLVDTRRGFVDVVEASLRDAQAERPGLFYGLPEKSIYEGMEEEVNAMLLGQQTHPMDVDSPARDKGKNKEDAMDIG
uniref:Uncharacterized protein n=1 Tax=Mycena chlorophos TaxID=658473 RepID=A0ABQ0LZE7_MYCCL|nr:predicted protein [Mycena chlorophos]